MSEWLWLFAAGFAPYFFNVASAQHFEADKAVGVRVLAIGALTVEVLRALRRGSSPGDVRALARRALRGTPHRVLAGGLALLVVSTLISTAISVEPRLSVWGSYERRQGALTFLSYVTLFVIAVVRLDPARVRRLVTVICQTAVAVSIYALAQASHHDPITWVLKAAGRPSSTFGNANAVAGYLAVTLAFVVMRLTRAWHDRTSKDDAAADFDWRRELSLVGTHVFLFANIALASRSVGWFGEPIRFALAIAVAASAWALRDWTTPAERRFFGNAVVAFGTLWACLTAGAVLTGRAALGGGDGVSLLALGSIAFWALRDRTSLGVEGARKESTAANRASRLVPVLGYVVALVTCLTAVVVSQARGAEAAVLASLLVLWNVRSARRHESSSSAGRSERRRRLVRAGAQGVLLALILIFNLSQHPVVRRARALPYIGRFGQWLAATEGTGRERLLIWRGDEHGGGVLGLVSATPLRSIVGYGPETLKETFARVFPPSLLEATGHGASPDRAHQVALDMLYTQGVLGLVALVATFGSLLWLAFRGVRESPSGAAIALPAACLAAGVGYVVDGATGIPTTASILMCWMAFAMTVHHARTRTAHQPATAHAHAGETRSLRPRWGAALLVVTAAGIAAWYGNLSTVVADMFLRAGSRARADTLATAIDRCEGASRALELAPREDAYASELGEALVLMSGHSRRARSPAPREDASRCGRLAVEQDARALLLRGRTALRLAYELNRGNKDRAAALARVNLLLYRDAREPTYLAESLDWYERAVKLAPNDVLLLNQRAAAVAMRSPDGVTDAERILRRSLELEGTLFETHLQLADLLLATGRTSEAIDEYAFVARGSAWALWTADGSRLRSVLSKIGGDAGHRRVISQALDTYLAMLRSELEVAPPSMRDAYLEEIAHAEAMLGEVSRASEPRE